MREIDIRVRDVKRRGIPSSSQRSSPSISYILYKSISIGSKFTKIMIFLFSFFLFISFYFNNILVVLSHIWHIFAIIRSFFFVILLLSSSMLRLWPANNLCMCMSSNA